MSFTYQKQSFDEYKNFDLVLDDSDSKTASQFTTAIEVPIQPNQDPTSIEVVTYYDESLKLVLKNRIEKYIEKFFVLNETPLVYKSIEYKIDKINSLIDESKKYRLLYCYINTLPLKIKTDIDALSITDKKPLIESTDYYTKLIFEQIGRAHV